MDFSNNKKSIFSFICFSLTGIATLMLFGGLFTARWDYVITHWKDTIFVLVLGTLIPILFFAGLYFFIKSIRKKESLYIIPLIMGIFTFLFCLVFYLTVLPSVIELYLLKLGLICMA